MYVFITAHTYRRDLSGATESRIPEKFSAPKNGIESLLQASAFTGPAGTDNQ